AALKPPGKSPAARMMPPACAAQRRMPPQPLQPAKARPPKPHPLKPRPAPNRAQGQWKLWVKHRPMHRLKKVGMRQTMIPPDTRPVGVPEPKPPIREKGAPDGTLRRSRQHRQGGAEPEPALAADQAGLGRSHFRRV